MNLRMHLLVDHIKRNRPYHHTLSTLHDQPQLSFARRVYYDVFEDSAPTAALLDRFPSMRDAFVQDMFNMAREGTDLSSAYHWKDRFASLGRRGPITPPRFDRWNDIKAQVDSYLFDLRPRIQEFLDQDEFLPSWTPPESWKTVQLDGNRTLYDHLRDLCIPVSFSRIDPTDRGPDLMVYKLGQFSEVDKRRMWTRLNLMLSGGEDKILVNTSGSGKTRLMFEALCLTWGFYFTCSSDPVQNPYGSRDMKNMFDPGVVMHRQAPNGRLFREFHDSVLFDGEVKDQLGANVIIIDNISSIILLARILIFDMFINILKPVRANWIAHGCSHNEADLRARRAWLILQIFPTRLRSSPNISDASSEDIFYRLVVILSNLDPGDCNRQIDRRNSKIPLPYRAKLVVFDEVQVVATRWTRAFNGTSIPSQMRPLLKPLANGVWRHLDQARVLVSGTKLRQKYVEQALASNVFKRAGSQQYSNFGGFFRDNDINNILSHFFPETFLSTLPPRVISAIYYWLRGRHRFLTHFIEWTLKTGPDPDSILNIVNNIVYQATTQKLDNFPPFTNLGMSFQPLIPESFPDYSTGGKTMIESREVRIVRKAMLTFLCFSEFPRFSPKKLALVDGSVGTFIIDENDKQSIRISERLVLCSLMNYFDDPRNPFGIRNHLNNMLSKFSSDAEPAGYGFEDSMIYLFWNLFTAKQPPLLTDVFAFLEDYSLDVHSDTGHEWAHCRAHIVTQWSSTPQKVQRELTSVLAQKARSFKDTVQWFDSLNDAQRSPFLKPDVRFGADIVFVLRLEDPDGVFDGKLLMVFVSCKAWRSARGGGTVENVLMSISPEGIYSSLSTESREAARRSLFAAFSSFPSLPGTRLPRQSPSDEPQGLTVDNGTETEITPSRTQGKPRKKKATKKAKSHNDQEKLPGSNFKPEYGPTVDFAILRCVACYPSMVKFSARSTAQGVYPLATLAPNVIQRGSFVGFDAFEEAMDRAKMNPSENQEEQLERLVDRFVLPEDVAPVPSAALETDDYHDDEGEDESSRVDMVEVDELADSTVNDQGHQDIIEQDYLDGINTDEIILPPVTPPNPTAAAARPVYFGEEAMVVDSDDENESDMDVDATLRRDQDVDAEAQEEHDFDVTANNNRESNYEDPEIRSNDKAIDSEDDGSEDDDSEDEDGVDEGDEWRFDKADVGNQSPRVKRKAWYVVVMYIWQSSSSQNVCSAGYDGEGSALPGRKIR